MNGEAIAKNHRRIERIREKESLLRLARRGISAAQIMNMLDHCKIKCAKRTFSGTSSNSGQDTILSSELKNYPISENHTTVTEIYFSEEGPHGKRNQLCVQQLI